jgi:putative peptidoglycan lipid II flippase
MNLLSSTTVFSFYTMLSRVLGYFRDILIAIFLGTSIYADAFFVAFRLPNTFRRLFAEGTFNAAFIPSYTSEKIKSKARGKKFADEVLTLLTLGLLTIVLIVEIFTPYIVYLIAPGFIEDNVKFNLAVDLTRITFPFLAFVSLSSFFAGILNSENKFAAAAAAPIFLNLILILSLVLSYYFKLDYALNLSYGVSLSGLIQLIFLIYFASKYYHPSLVFKKKVKQKVKFFLKKLLPSIFSSGVIQISILVGTIIASFQAGAVSYLYYADRVYQINLAIAGIAVSTVSLPILSNLIKNKKTNQAHKMQNKSLELSLLLSLPASIALIIGSEQIVNSLFGYGSFTENDIEQTSLALKYFGFGIPAFAMLKIFANFFFARDNTMSPFKVSSIVVTINIAISVAFFKQIGFIIIPIATTLSTWIGVFYYLYLLLKIGYLKINPIFYINSVKIVFSTSIMSYIFHNSLNYFAKNLSYSSDYKILYLLFIVIFVALLYFLICYFLKVLNVRSFKTN